MRALPPRGLRPLPVELWRELHPAQASADAIDARLHAERVDPAARRSATTRRALDELPDGAFVLRDGEPRLVLGARAARAGRRPATPSARRGPRAARATLITPPSLVAVLRAGWQPRVPLLHPSALANRR